MQSLMRSAKVGPGGVLTPKGQYAGKAAVQQVFGSDALEEDGSSGSGAGAGDATSGLGGNSAMDTT